MLSPINHITIIIMMLHELHTPRFYHFEELESDTLGWEEFCVTLSVPHFPLCWIREFCSLTPPKASELGTVAVLSLGSS